MQWGAKAALSDSVNETGWIYLEIETNPVLDDDSQMYEAGFIEGAITQKYIYYHWYNTWRTFCDDKPKTCKNIDGFLNANTKWLKPIIKKYSKFDPWWHHANLYYIQLEGILAGYRNATKNCEESLLWHDIFMMNMAWDLDTLVDVLADDTEREKIGNTHIGHCSAMIKLLPDYSDLIVGHNTWTGYNTMLRILKKYNFTIHMTPQSDEVIPGNIMTFSSYPGVTISGDDFNIMSSGLVTMETTNEVYGKSLWKYITPERTTMEAVRAMIANRIAHNGREWRDAFVQRNSGTYNNQWMIIDYKQLTPGKRPNYNLFWIVEQMPGIIFSTDLTISLDKSTYWASYNVPYFEYIFNISGYLQKEKEFGDWYSHSNNPRALIFKREHVNVTEVNSLMALLRYNNYLQEPFAVCNCTPIHNACNSIAARCDLNPESGTYPIPNLQHRMHGAIDAKVTNSKLAQEFKTYAVSGPTSGPDVPPFKWTSIEPNDHMDHLGHPEIFNFKPEVHNWVL